MNQANVKQISDKQATANKKNALMSTGAKTIKGKETVSKNAIKHGLTTSANIIIDDTEKDFYESILESLINDFNPETQTEKVFIEKLAHITLKKQRLIKYEQSLLQSQQLETKRKINDVETSPDYKKIKWLNREIKELKEAIKMIKDNINGYKLLSKSRRKDKNEYLESYNSDLAYYIKRLQNTVESFLSFSSYEAFPDGNFKSGYIPKDENLEHYRELYITFKIIQNDLESEEKEPSVYIYYKLERLLEILQKRLKYVQNKLDDFNNWLNTEKEMQLMKLDIIPNETNHQKIERYEAYLDNQFHKTLQELQKLQAFFLQKQQFTS